MKNWNKLLLSLLPALTLGTLLLNASVYKHQYAYAGQSAYESVSWSIPAGAGMESEVVGYQGGQAWISVSGAGINVNLHGGSPDPVNTYVSGTTSYAGTVSGYMSVQATSGNPNAFAHTLLNFYW